MAGDWMKIEKVTPDKPEIDAMSAELDIDPDAVFGKCFRVWRWFDDHTTDGNAPSVTKAAVDRRAGVSGFSDAMERVGWLISSDRGVSLPKFDRHNGETSKARSLTAKRVANHSKKKHAANSTVVSAGVETSEETNAASVSFELAREEKNTEEKYIPPPPREHSPQVVAEVGMGDAAFQSAPSEGFRKFWGAYPRKLAPNDAWKTWQGTLSVLMQQRGMTDAEIEQFLIDRAEVYAMSPSGTAAPPGDDDFRPSPAKWLKDGKYDEPYAEWQTPNGKGLKNGKRGAGGQSKARSPGSECVKSRVSINSLLEDSIAGGVASSAS